MSEYDEYIEDFSWEETRAFAEIVCNGLDAVDLQFLEDFAHGVWGEDA